MPRVTTRRSTHVFEVLLALAFGGVMAYVLGGPKPDRARQAPPPDPTPPPPPSRPTVPPKPPAPAATPTGATPAAPRKSTQTVRKFTNDKR